jgi:hypothetical protein
VRQLIVINGGIGDMILSRALLDARGEPVDVALDGLMLSLYRSQEHRAFAETLFSHLFQEPMYRRVDRPGNMIGVTPQQLVAMTGASPAMPDLRDTLTGGDRETGRGCVAVTTKVRGWGRQNYEAVRDEFLAAVRDVAAKRPLVLVGERQVGMTREYLTYEDGFVFSIYEDIAEFAAVDETVDELGVTPPQWSRFLADCDIMQNAEAVITLGSGGNVSMAAACGRRAVAMIANTEMGGYMAAIPPCDRVSLCLSWPEYLKAVRQ